MKKPSIFQFVLALFCALSFSWQAYSQLNTTSAAPYNTAAALVDVLVDASITTNNITSYGATYQMGYFWGGGTVVNIDSGICMSSGNISGMASGGPGFNSTAVPAGANQGGGDPDLLSVAASVPGLIGATFAVNTTWNAAIIEFDFVPVTDSVEFNYLMTSEEWHAWTCTTFNDVFGFFVSGPGITGPYSSPLGFPNGAINVATVPGTNPALPVTISTIHNGTGFGVPNCANAFNNAFFIPTANNTNFNARTVVLTAKFPVIQCNTYHMKLAIADGSDQIYDSGVYLEANSFSGSGISIVANPTYTNPNIGGGTQSGDTVKLYEGCGNVELFFIRHTDSIALPDTVNYTILGSATNGIDYTYLNNSIVFPPNQDSASLTFTVFNDGIPEGIEYLRLVIDSNSTVSCANDSTIIDFEICDVPDLLLSMGPDTTVNCTEDSVHVFANATNGLEPFTYQWNSLQVDSGFNALPPNTTTYEVTVTDACGVNSTVGTQTVTMYSPPWGLQKINDQQTINCTSDSVELAVAITGNWYPGFTYNWVDDQGDTISQDSTVDVFSFESTQYTLYVDHYCVPPGLSTRSYDLLVQNDPVVLNAENVTADFILCPGDTVPMTVNVSGGYPGYSVWWSSGGNDFTERVGPKFTDTFQVWVTDTCKLDTMTTDVIVYVPIPPELEILNVETDTINCLDDIIYLGRTIAGRGGTNIDSNYIFSWTNWADTEPIHKVVLTQTSSYTVEMTDVCHYDTTSLTIDLVLQDNGPLELEVPEDFHLCPGLEVELVAQGINGGGNYTYTWFPDRETNGTRWVAPNQTTEYTVRVTDECDSQRVESFTVFVEPIEANFEYNYVSDYEVEFTNRSSGFIDDYLWVFGDGEISNDQNPVHAYPSGSDYSGKLIVTNDFGCADTLTKTMSPSLWLWIPNSFTPNGDGLNDMFKIEGLGMRAYELSIYDRWGSLIYYEDQDTEFKGWDGTIQGRRVPMGAYVYRVKIIGDDDQTIDRAGTVSLVNDLRER